MKAVTLVSGGLDSSLMTTLLHEEGVEQFPLFVDYGQRGKTRELESCRRNLARLNLVAPTVVDLSGYATLLPSGLTDPSLDVEKAAFLPGRNALFLLTAGAYASKVGAGRVYIGLLHEAYSLFPDQTQTFLREMETMLCRAMGREVRVLAPLMVFSKGDVVAMAREKGVVGTYSCHTGGPVPCGRCIACKEFRGLEV